MISTEELHSKFLECNAVTTDTRKISEGSIFFALKGPNFNANMFAKDALEKGAEYAVIDEPKYEIKNKTLLVNDVLTSLQQLATYHRNFTNVKVLAITGSNGKTTTKELCFAVIKNKFKSFATQGNLNNHIGVPLTILSMPEKTEFLVLEMGANHQKEIEFLCQIGQPDFGLITNIGKAHLEGFGGFEGVKKGKGELYEYLIKNNKLIFICRDNKILMEILGNYKNIISYGAGENNFCTGKIIKESPTLSLEWKHNKNRNTLNSQLTGSYNFENILTAITTGVYFGLNEEAINESIENYIPENKRSEIIKGKTNTIIADYYNANPTSMEAALKNLASMEARSKYAILGDMLELGDDTINEHKHIIDLLKKYNIKNSILVGPKFKSLNENQFYFFESTDEAKKWIENNRINNSLILVKGSRGVQLEKLLPELL